MRRLLAMATNVDECRLIVDMFFAKSGLHLEPVDSKLSLAPDVSRPVPGGDTSLEHSLVELFLGGAGEESEADGDEQTISSAGDGPTNKESPVALPMLPPESIHGNGVITANPVVIKDFQMTAIATVAVT